MKRSQRYSQNYRVLMQARQWILFVVVLLVAGPGVLSAQVEQCDAEVNAEALGGPIFLVNEPIRISANIGAGDVTGGDENYLDISTFGFLLDCSGDDTYPSCTAQGNTVIYANDITTDCKDSAGDDVVFDAVVNGDRVDFTANSGLPVRNFANTTCNVQFDVVVTALADDNPGDTIVQILGWLSQDGVCDNGLNASGSSSVSFDISARRAQFRVTKDFTDDNPASVDVHLSCNTGLPLDQSKTISEFDGGVTFVVNSYDAGELDCHVTENPVPAGYTESYAAGTVDGVADTISDDENGCHYLDVIDGTFTCVVTDTVDETAITVHKEWIGDFEENDISQYASADWTCYNTRQSPSGDAGTFGGGLEFNGDSSDNIEGLYPHYDGTSYCTVTENGVDDAVETDDSDCSSVAVTLGTNNECTIYNTLFLEGIPTLSQYGMALLALLMLTAGLLGVRRVV